MADKPTHNFEHIPGTPQGHFVLYFYAAVFRLINRLQVLAQSGGPSLEKFFHRYPFLGEYYNEILNYLPNDISWKDALKWWHTEITVWEEKCDKTLPIILLKDSAGLSFDNRLAFIAVGLVEEDSRFGTVFAELQAPLDLRRPTLEFIAQTISIGLDSDGEESAWSLCQPLIDLGLVEVMNEQVPRSEWIVRVPAILWDAVRGSVKENPTNWCRFYRAVTFPETGELIYPEEMVARIKHIPALITQGKLNQLLLRSDAGTDTVEVVGSIAGSLGMNLMVVDGDAAVGQRDLHLLGPLCSMSHSVPLFEYDTGPGATIEAPVLRCYSGLVSYALGLEGGVSSKRSERMLTLTLNAPDLEMRERYWRRALNGTPHQDLDRIVDHFHVSGGYIKHMAALSAAVAGSHGREQIQFHDVQDAGRTLNRQKLDTLADRLESTGKWNDLVVTFSTSDKLLEVQRRCLYREKLRDKLGPAFGGTHNRGVRALFAGASGTGKTMAAKILAAELGIDLYRV
ncbi:MAG: ATP-binding protein, partial [Gammaproteobacteria bacterium]|nr:ATP-binding protein [Gammaproteobacteria bacterium]